MFFHIELFMYYLCYTIIFFQYPAAPEEIIHHVVRRSPETRA